MMGLTHLTDAQGPADRIRGDLGFWQRASFWLRLRKERLKEYLGFDCVPFQKLAGMCGLIASVLMGLVGKPRRSFLLLSKLHRANSLRLANRRAERLTRTAAAS